MRKAICAVIIALLTMCSGCSLTKSSDKTRQDLNIQKKAETKATAFGTKKQSGTITNCGRVKKVTWSKLKNVEQIVLTMDNRIDPDISERYGFGLENNETYDYKIQYQLYPCRLEMTLVGPQGWFTGFPSLKGSRLIRSIYKVVVLDDQTERLALDLKKQSVFEVTTKENPSRIIIKIRENKNASKKPKVYSVRTGSIDFGEPLGVINEELRRIGSEKSRILITAGGKYCVEEGYYKTRDAAEARIAKLEEARADLSFSPDDLHIEKRAVTELPKLINK